MERGVIVEDEKGSRWGRDKRCNVEETTEETVEVEEGG